MSYFLADSTGPLAEFASIGGFADFRAWAQKQQAPVRRFVHFGFTEDLAGLKEALQGIRAPIEVEEQRELLVHYADEAKDVLIISDGMSDEEPEVRVAASRSETEVHAAADAHEKLIRTSVRYAFAKGRAAVDKAALRRAQTIADASRAVSAVPTAVQRALEKTLPEQLWKTFVAGGQAAVSRLHRLGQLRAAGGRGSGNFGHSGRPGEVGGSGESFHGTSVAAAKSIKTEGLKPTRSIGGRGAWVTTSEELALHYAMGKQAGGQVAVVVVDKSAKPYFTTKARAATGESTLASRRTIPPSYIREVRVYRVSDIRKWRESGSKGTTAQLRESLTQVKYRTLDEGDFFVVFELDDELRTAADDFLQMSFDVKNKRAAQWAKQHAAELIDDLAETTKQAIAEALVRGFEGGKVGSAYHDVLDALFEDDVLSAVGDDVRADMIVKTEAMRAANGGQREAWMQAVDKGLLTGDEQRVWIATEVGPCDICEALDGTTAPLDGEYGGEGGEGPPAHPRCRCTEGLIA